MSMLELVIGVVAVLLGLFGFRKWSESQGAKKKEFERRKNILENKKKALAVAQKRVSGHDSKLQETQKKVEEEIRQLNREIAKELEKSEERKEEISQLDDDALADRVNELLGGSGG